MTTRERAGEGIIVNESGLQQAGAAGGLFAIAVLVINAGARALPWVAAWKDRRETTRAAKLERWHEELVRREAQNDEAVASRLSALEKAYGSLFQQHVAVLGHLDRARMAYRVIANALAHLAPQSDALTQARDILEEPLPSPKGPIDLAPLPLPLDPPAAAPGQP